MPVLAMLLMVAAVQVPVLEHQASGTTARLQAVSVVSSSVVSSSVVWASGARGTYARTTDGGAHWLVGVVPGADSLEFRDLHAVSAEEAFLLSAGTGDRSRIYRTADGGRTWALQFTNPNPAAFFDCLAFWDPLHGLAASDAVNGVFIVIRTRDGGAHWEPLGPSGLPPARVGEGMFAASGTCLTALAPSRAWLGTGVKAARVLRTEDGGATWEAADTPIVQNTATAGIMSVVFFDARHGMALGGDLGVSDTLTDNVALTQDGGATWSLAVGRPTFPGAVYGAAVVPGRDRTVVAVGPRGASWTPDAGSSWSALDSRDYWSVGFGPGGVGWMVGPGGRITRVTFGAAPR